MPVQAGLCWSKSTATAVEACITAKLKSATTTAAAGVTAKATTTTTTASPTLTY